LSAIVIAEVDAGPEHLRPTVALLDYMPGKHAFNDTLAAICASPAVVFGYAIGFSRWIKQATLLSRF